MSESTTSPETPGALTSVGPQWFRDALTAGIHRVIHKRDYINKINVFPVADADTGTNLAFTLNGVLQGIRNVEYSSIGDFFNAVAERAIDGARGNSGAIFAQFLQGFAESIENRDAVTVESFANATAAGALAAHAAIAEPREGTMLSVIRDYGKSLENVVAEGVKDLRQMFRLGLEAARVALAETPEQLEILKQNNVVDAGAQGFVELLEGIHDYADTGSLQGLLVDDTELGDDLQAFEISSNDTRHRFCTECMVTGDQVDRTALKEVLTNLDSSSLVIAGTKRKVRVHIHVNNPGQVFLACEDFGVVTSQKADDMHQQSRTAHSQVQPVAVVTDTGADIPEDEVERLSVHLVPLRVNFRDQQFLDKVSLTPSEFYDKLRSEDEIPRTSQPPPGDFRRQFEFLASHHESVLCLSISGALSGTWQNAQSAASRTGKSGQVLAWDTLNASAGQGLLVTYAAELAAQGLELPRITESLQRMGEKTKTFAVISDLEFGVRGGRIKGWVKSVADVLRLTPIVGNKEDGTIGPVGVLFGRSELPRRFANWLIRHLDADKAYRIVIAHCDNPEGARAIRRVLVERLTTVQTVHKTEAGTALGAHAGPGTLIVGVQPVEELS